jgi:hypothetical protein
MTNRWLRLEPGRRENLQAAGLALGVAAGVAAVVFYFGRIVISRERMHRLRDERDETSGLPASTAKRLPERARGR